MVISKGLRAMEVIWEPQGTPRSHLVKTFLVVDVSGILWVVARGGALLSIMPENPHKQPRTSTVPLRLNNPSSKHYSPTEMLNSCSRSLGKGYSEYHQKLSL